MASPPVYSLCGMCNTRCPVEIHCEDGVPRWVCGNSHSPYGTALCPRGAAALALYADDERPQGPLIRVGARGAGKWRSVGWNEALDYVADRLKKIMAAYGPRSLLWSERPGPFSDMSKALLRGLGSPNYCTHDDACAHNVNQASFSLTGYGRSQWLYDYKNCRHLVVQGRNLLESLKVAELNQVLDALEAGCRMTCVDVRPTVTGLKAQESICIRPGTDLALNLAVLHVLIGEGLYDAAYVERHVQDLAVLADFVRPYSPQWAESRCDVPAGVITQLARSLAAAAPQVIWHGGWMSTRYRQSFMISRTAYLINALLGAFGSKGGLLLAAGARDAGRKGLRSFTSLYAAPLDKRADGVGWAEPAFAPNSSLLHRAFRAVESGVPYPVKAYFTLKHDPLSAMPDPERQKAQLAGLELMVSLTFSWSDTAWFSDVVLPMPSFVERGSLLQAKSGRKPSFVMRSPAADIRFDTRPDWWILGQLARRLGLDELAFETLEAVWRFQLEGTGISAGDFRYGSVSLTDAPIDLGPRFATPSGKIEVLFGPWQEAGLPSLLPWQEVERPGPGQFRLIVGRNARHTQSHTQNNVLLHDSLPENTAWIAEERARELGVRDGDPVRMEGADGKGGEIRVRLVAGMHPDVLFMLHGFGHQLPVESRARRRGLADQVFMCGGLDREDAMVHGLAMQEHFVTLHPVITRSTQGGKE